MRRMAVALDLDVSQAVADSMNVRVEGQLTFNTLWRRLRAARAGLGIAFVPEDVADADIDAGRLVRVLMDWCVPFRPLCRVAVRGAEYPLRSWCVAARGIYALTTHTVWSVISVMTEITDKPDTLRPAVRRFVLEWGSLGERWGVNRSVSQIHALLYASKQPLAAEEIAEVLGIARSNVSNSLRELQSWNIIRSVPILGDRRTFYTAETDLWNLVTRIAAGRKARELDPATAALRECVEMSRDDESVDPVVELRLREMLDFVERLGRWYEQMITLKRSTIVALMKMGGGVARLLDRGGKRNQDPS